MELGEYRYGFNGKENDNEIKGEGNQQDYGMRIYDPRVGKFLSVDPLTKEYPWNSTYAFAENDVIRSIDVDGLEKLIVVINKDKYGRISSMVLKGIRDIDLKKAVDANVKFANKKDVTEEDVLIITRMEGKADMLSYSNLNDSYRKIIKNAPKYNHFVDDNTMSMPKDAQVALAIDANYRGKVLRGEATYDESKYEIFSFKKNNILVQPKEFKMTLDMFDNSDGKGSDEFEQNMVNLYSHRFDQENPEVNSKLIEVTLTGRNAALPALWALKKRLENNISNIHVEVKSDKKFKIDNSPSKDPDKDYKVEVKISGVKL